MPILLMQLGKKDADEMQSPGFGSDRAGSEVCTADITRPCDPKGAESTPREPFTPVGPYAHIQHVLCISISVSGTWSYIYISPFTESLYLYLKSGLLYLYCT